MAAAAFVVLSTNLGVYQNWCQFLYLSILNRFSQALLNLSDLSQVRGRYHKTPPRALKKSKIHEAVTIGRSINQLITRKCISNCFDD